MKRKRRKHSAEFKARVALEALKGVKTINQIAQDEGGLPVQVSTWKKELQVGLPTVFQSGAKHRQDEEKAERDRARLERKVGQLVVEREFLEKVRTARDRSERKAMIETGHKKLSVRRQDPQTRSQLAGEYDNNFRQVMEKNGAEMTVYNMDFNDAAALFPK